MDLGREIVARKTLQGLFLHFRGQFGNNLLAETSDGGQSLFPDLKQQNSLAGNSLPDLFQILFDHAEPFAAVELQSTAAADIVRRIEDFSEDQRYAVFQQLFEMIGGHAVFPLMSESSFPVASRILSATG